MRRSLFVSILCMGSLVTLGSCGSGSNSGPTPTRGPFELTLEGDASFQGPHGGQSISVAVLNVISQVVAEDDGLVSASMDPTFSFSFSDLLADGVVYEVHYWIDSNVGGGTVGICDPPVIDHQWSVSITARNDLTVVEDHNDADNSQVCATFN